MGRYYRRRPVIPERVPLTVDTLRDAIRVEKRTETVVRAAATTVLRLGDGGYYEIRYDPERVRAQTGDPARIDQQFEGALFRTPNEASGLVLLVEEGKAVITVRVGAGQVVRPATAFTLRPLSWLGDLQDWAAGIERLPGRFEKIEEDALSRETPAGRLPRRVQRLLRPGQRAVLAAARRPVLLLWGPPGTGKTYTLGALAALLLRQGETIVGLSTTNVAVDRLTLAIDDACRESGRPLRPGELVRAGRPQERELSEDPGRRHLLRWTEVLDEFARRRERIRQQLEAVEETLRRGATTLDEDVIVRLKAERAELIDQRLELDQERARVLKELAAEARCVTTTFAAWVMNRALWEKRYTRLLVDEASMVSLAAVARAMASPALEGAVFAGDFRQLAPISRAGNRSSEAMAWFGRSVFEMLGLEKRARRRLLREAGGLVMLTEQGRMNETICEAVSDSFYDGELRTVGSPPEPPTGRPVPAEPLLVIDPYRVEPPGGASRMARMPQRVRPSGWQWDRSAMIARALTEALLGLDRRWPDRVIVVSPFRAQAFLLERLLQPLDPDRVKVGTIHRMQGDEADIVIFDPVVPGSPFLAADRASPRLVNVAISRARGQVFLLGDREKLRANPWLEAFVDRAVSWVPDWQALGLEGGGREGSR